MLFVTLGPYIILTVLLLVGYFGNHGVELGGAELAGEQLLHGVPSPHVGGEVLFDVGELAARERAVNPGLVLGIVVLKVRYQGGRTGEGPHTVVKITHETCLGRILFYFQFLGCYRGKLSWGYFLNDPSTVKNRLVQKPSASNLDSMVNCA